MKTTVKFLVAALVASLATVAVVSAGIGMFQINFDALISNGADATIVVDGVSYDTEGSIDIDWGTVTTGDNLKDFTIVNTGGTQLTVTTVGVTVTAGPAGTTASVSGVSNGDTIAVGSAVTGTITLTIPSSAPDGATVSLTLAVDVN